jgi:hypothetical protein
MGIEIWRRVRHQTPRESEALGANRHGHSDKSSKRRFSANSTYTVSAQAQIVRNN